jgi:hypothetical protein
VHHRPGWERAAHLGRGQVTRTHAPMFSRVP